jgi:uncharacterized protein (DUF1800 family)
MESRAMNKSCLISVCLLICGWFGLGTLQAGNFLVPTPAKELEVKTQIYASHFLHAATFGPSLTQINALATEMRLKGVRQACSEWISREFAKPMTLHQGVIESMLTADGFAQNQPNIWITRYRHHAWWDTALNGNDQLRQRVAWALAQILVTSEDGEGFGDESLGNISGKGRWLGPTNYYDTLVRHSFGNYRNLLQDVTYHPVMGVYLSSMKNRKSNGSTLPDENFARELMQLFTIGLYQLNLDGSQKTTSQGQLIPTYDNDDIQQLARVFTGLTFKSSNPQNVFYSGDDFQYPMEMYQPEHEPGPKTLLDGTILQLPSGNAEISATLDHLFNNPNVAPFICYRLIQRLVKSNPSKAYVQRVAAIFENNGSGVRGDMKAVVKRILLDDEFFAPIRMQTVTNPTLGKTIVVSTLGTEYSRLREPVIRYASLLRGVDAVSDYPTGRAMVSPGGYEWMQETYRQPNVFGFYLPNDTVPGPLATYTPSNNIASRRLVGPEFRLNTAVTINRTIDRYIYETAEMRARFELVDTNYSMICNLDYQLDEEIALAGNLTGLLEIADRFDIVHCCGTMPQNYKGKLARVVRDETQWMAGDPSEAANMRPTRVSMMLLMTAVSPFAAIAE